MKLAVVLGTRPEAIKLAPLIIVARSRQAAFTPVVVSTGQHADMLPDVLDFFAIKPDYDLGVMTHGQTLAGLTARLLQRLDSLFYTLQPDVVVVQGDTTTALCAAVAAFYRRVPVAHVEAGLRTDRLDAPFPEEFNRRVVAQAARWHFAPTDRARQALLRDGIPLLGGQIVVTGNTVIDALFEAVDRVRAEPPQDPDLAAVHEWLAAGAERRMVLVTGHRRESFGKPFADFCLALRDVAGANPQTLLIYPAHLNPNVQQSVRDLLGGLPNCLVTLPKPYPVFVSLMMAADLIITDSGGVQEEAPALGKPVLVTRQTTERPEAVYAGMATLVGTSRREIVVETEQALAKIGVRYTPRQFASPYGDGRAAKRCLDALLGLPVQEFDALVGSVIASIVPSASR